MLDNVTRRHQQTTTTSSTLIALNDKFAVGRASLNDLTAILDIYNQSIAGKQATAQLAPVTSAERVSWFDEHLNDPKRPIYVVTTTSADSPAVIVAWGSFSDLYARTAYHISSEVSIYLHRDYHRQGLGRLLIEWMLTQAPSLGIHNVVALIFAHNTPSLTLFRKLGFEQWGYMPKVCDMQGFIADVVMLGIAIDNNVSETSISAKQ